MALKGGDDDEINDIISAMKEESNEKHRNDSKRIKSKSNVSFGHSHDDFTSSV